MKFLEHLLPQLIMLLILISTSSRTGFTQNSDFVHDVSTFQYVYEMSPQPEDKFEIDSNFLDLEQQFNGIIGIPGLFRHPDHAYSYLMLEYQDSDRPITNDYVSRAGKDEFYIRYAFFLHRYQYYVLSDYNDNRKVLYKLFNMINDFYFIQAGGGNYHGHVASRVPAFCEFELAKLTWGSCSLDNDQINTEEKKIFMDYLRNQIGKFSTIPKSELEATQQRLESVLNQIDKLITNNYYLQAAENFDWHIEK